MSNARNERLIREALGGNSGMPFPERVIRNVGLIAFAILVAVAVTPSKDSKPLVVSSAIDARAATTVNDAPPARLSIDPKATEGNVVDMTY